MLAGAVVTPTDPIVSSAIVTGSVAERNLPDDVRHTISAESGANDGLAYPFVLLPILMLSRPPGEALLEWATRILLWEVLGAALFGALAGYAAGRLLEWAEAKRTVEETSFLAYTLALSLAVLGAGKLLGTDGILAVFVAGVAFDTAVRGGERQEEERVQEAVNRFFTLPIFVLLGLVLPWEGWAELGWRAPVLAAAVLLLRRLPALLALHPLLGRVRWIRPGLFMGWFGPIGVAALFYANFALGRTGHEEVWTVGSLLIAASVLAHGLTATPLTRLYGRSRRRGDAGEKGRPATGGEAR